MDYDYRGNVGVILFNHSDVDFEVKRGDRIAQLILERISMADVAEVEVMRRLIFKIKLWKLYDLWWKKLLF